MAVSVRVEPEGLPAKFPFWRRIASEIRRHRHTSQQSHHLSSRTVLFDIFEAGRSRRNRNLRPASWQGRSGTFFPGSPGSFLAIIVRLHRIAPVITPRWSFGSMPNCLCMARGMHVSRIFLRSFASKWRWPEFLAPRLPFAALGAALPLPHSQSNLTAIPLQRAGILDRSVHSRPFNDDRLARKGKGCLERFRARPRLGAPWHQAAAGSRLIPRTALQLATGLLPIRTISGRAPDQTRAPFGKFACTRNESLPAILSDGSHRILKTPQQTNYKRNGNACQENERRFEGASSRELFGSAGHTIPT